MLLAPGEKGRIGEKRCRHLSPWSGAIDALFGQAARIPVPRAIELHNGHLLDARLYGRTGSTYRPNLQAQPTGPTYRPSPGPRVAMPKDT